MNSEELYQKYIKELEGLTTISLWHPNLDDICNDSTYRLMFESIIFNTLKSIHKTVTSSNWANLRKDYIAYLTFRENQTINPLLKSRYAAIKAICFKKDVDSAYNIITSYFTIIIHSNLDFATFSETFSALVHTFVLLKKLPSPSIYDFFAALLNDNTILDTNKCVLIDSILKCDISGFKVTQIPNFYCLCEPILDRIKEKQRRKRLITNMIDICDKLKNSDSIFSEYKKSLYELLADNEMQFVLDEDDNNGMIAHINHNILQNIKMWYKEAGNHTKMNEIEQQIIQLKHSRKFITFQHNLYSKEQEEIMNKFFDIVHNFNIITYLSGLADNYFGFFPSHNYIIQQSSLITYESDFEIVKVDDCGNETKIKEENLPTYNYYLCYEQFFQPVITNFSQQVLDKIADGSLTFRKVKSVLIKETILGKKYITMLGYEQSLYDFIDQPLRNLFSELRKLVKHKEYNLIIPLETLCLKIERLLREILYIQGVSTLSTSPDKEQFILFDKILQSLQDNDTFNLEDINYFRYVLTNEGYNLRNYTAHGIIDVRYNRTMKGINSCIALFVLILKIAYNIKPDLKF